MNPKQLIAELASGHLRPAYLLVGEEALLRDRSLAAIREAVVPPDAGDFNFDRLSGNACSAALLRDTLATLPVLADRRLIVLVAPDPRRAASRALLDSLVELVSSLNPAPENVLVVTTPKADKRSRWVKAFRDPACLVVCDAPRETREIVEFVEEEGRQQGFEWASGAAHFLTELVGPQMLLLRQEISKIALLLPPGERATRQHVALATHAVAERPIWDLTDAIGEGQTALAVERLASTMRHGTPLPVLLASLATHFRKLIRVADGESVAGPPFVVRKMKKQVGRYSSGRLEACLGFIHQTDLALKGGGELAEELAMERLVIALSS